MDDDGLYRLFESRDPRFDGRVYLGVTSTGIYCRPSCPAMAPKRSNMRFYRTAAAAQRAGFRACKRCRPDASPGSPEWNVRADAVGRAMRLIQDGVLDREGVVGIARRLGYSERHLHAPRHRRARRRPARDRPGAARADRADADRDHRVPFTDVAFAAGFASIRQFNDTVREVFAQTPTELRARVPPGRPRPAARSGCACPTAPRSRGTSCSRSSAPRDRRAWRRSRTAATGACSISRTGSRRRRWRRATATSRARSRSTTSATSRRPWRRCAACSTSTPTRSPSTRTSAPTRRCGRSSRRDPGCACPAPARRTRSVARAIAGPAGLGGRRAHARRPAGGALRHAARRSPTARSRTRSRAPQALAEAADEALAMPARRRDTFRTRDAADRRRRPRSLARRRSRRRPRATSWPSPGIGPWTAEYVAMRALGDPDAWPATDLGVRHALARARRPTPSAAERWRPWRSYATFHLWSSL